VLFSETSKPILTIWTGDSEDPYKTLDLDDEAKKYINIRVNQITKTYVDGVEKVTNKYFPVKKCSINDFKTEHELNYWKFIKDMNYYCIDDPKKEAYL